MAHRGTRGRGISQSQRRKKTWVQLNQLIGSGTGSPGRTNVFAITITNSATPGVGVQDGFIAADGDGTGADPLISTLPDECTILRVRGNMTFPAYDLQDPIVAGMASETAFGFGVAALKDLNADSYPGPASEASWDGWMFRRAAPVSPVDSIGTVIDVKAMRKVKSGDAFFFMMEQVNISTTADTDFDWLLDLRLLLLLP